MIPDHDLDPLPGERPEEGDDSDYQERLAGNISAYGPAYDAPYTDGLLEGGALYTDYAHLQPESNEGPSLSIILISAACGMAGGVFGLYISYGVLGWRISLSAGLTTLGLLVGLGLSGAALTAATGERGAVVNMVFSCTLVALVVLFMTMCAVAGAAVATLLMRV